jgi:DhnA family fructose-bisphosphate aldolase class Ia
MVKVNFPQAAKQDGVEDAGATGLIFGRNVFQRGHDESLRFVAQLKEILAKYPS